MSNETKIHLSKFETELIQNKEWILAKRSVTNKVADFFGEINNVYKNILQSEALQQLQNVNGKISRGENYEGLPYIMMDYPALFTKENVFAIRTMFWWANFFSISLHISGKHFQLKENFLKSFSFLKQNHFFICVNENEWQHHFEPDNFIAAEDLSKTEFNKILQKDFFKISKKIELEEWNNAAEFLEKSFQQIIAFLKINFQDGEINL